MNMSKNPLKVLAYCLLAVGALVLFLKVILPFLIGLFQTVFAIVLIGALVYVLIRFLQFVSHRNRLK